MILPSHDRYDFSPIANRTVFDWPGGKRLAFCITTSIETYAYGHGLGDDSCVIGAPQTQRNYGWRDYGNRVGIWRLLEMFDELELPAAHAINSLVYERYPRIVERIRARRDEVVGHGRTSAESVEDLWESDELRFIREATDVYLRGEGKQLEGWLGSALAESDVTPDLIKEAGYTYLMDWPCDDQPFWMRTRTGPILLMPYSVEVNDAFLMVHRQRSAREFEEVIVNQYDELVEECDRHPLVLSIGLHSFVAGQPYRLSCLKRALKHCLDHPLRERVWFTQPGEIAKYCYSLPRGTLPGD